MSLKRVWPRHTGVGTDNSPAPFQSHSCPGGGRGGASRAGSRGQRETQAPLPSSSTSSQRGACSARPGLPSPPVAVVPSTGIGEGLGVGTATPGTQ